MRIKKKPIVCVERCWNSNKLIDMEKWMVQAKKADFYGIAAKYGIDPVIARIMVNRGVPEEAMGEALEDLVDKLNK